MSKELVNKVARAIASNIFGWTANNMKDLDFTTATGTEEEVVAHAAVAAIQAMTPQDKLGSPERALRASAAFIKFHTLDVPPCFNPKDDAVALALRARQGDKGALAQLLALVEGAEGTG